MTSKGARFSPGRFPGAFAQAAAGVLQCTGGEGRGLGEPRGSIAPGNDMLLGDFVGHLVN